MNEYQVTYSNGKIVEIAAWTEEIAKVIAEEEADDYGHGLHVVSVELLTPQRVE